MSHNNLLILIPQSLEKSQKLTMFDLSNNKHIGKILVGCQMDILNDKKFYGNNCGLCGMQIWVLCPKDLSPTKPPAVKLKETCFSWEEVKIGYAISFFVVVGILYLTKYFVPVKLQLSTQTKRRRV